MNWLELSSKEQIPSALTSATAEPDPIREPFRV